MGLGGYASYKDFQVTDEEWRHLVGHKEQSAGNPFQSGPTGGSLGIFHRKIRIDSIRERPSSMKSVTEDGGGESQSGGLRSEAKPSSVRSSLAEEVEGAETRPQQKARPFLCRRKTVLPRDNQGALPWRQKQKP